MTLILEAVKKALTEGEASVNLREAATLTDSGSGVGGRVYSTKNENPKPPGVTIWVLVTLLWGTVFFTTSVFMLRYAEIGRAHV